MRFIRYNKIKNKERLVSPGRKPAADRMMIRHG